MPALKWTEEAIRQEALKYPTRKAFKDAGHGAVAAARALGVYEDVCSHMKVFGWTEATILAFAAKCETRGEFSGSTAFAAAKRRGMSDAIMAGLPRSWDLERKWTRESLQQEALKYNTRTEFRQGSSGAASAADNMGVYDDICSHMVKGVIQVPKWTAENLPAEALKYSTRTAFARGSSGADAAAKRLGIYASICSHMPAPVVWDRASVMAEARKYTTRAEFSRGASGAWAWGVKHGIVDEMYAHMVAGSRLSANDTLYVWKACGEYFNQKQVYKIGVTSERSGAYRVRECAAAWGVDAEIIILQPVQGKATDHEKVLHILGDDPQYATGDGRTEFRALSDSELQEAIQYIEEVAA